MHLNVHVYKGRLTLYNFCSQLLRTIRLVQCNLILTTTRYGCSIQHESHSKVCFKRLRQLMHATIACGKGIRWSNTDKSKIRIPIPRLTQSLQS